MGRKPVYTLEDAREIFKKVHLELLEDSLEDEKGNRKEKLKYRCLVCGDVSYIRLSDARAGYSCASCSGNKKTTFQQIKEIYQKENFEVISSASEYKNVHSILKIKHSCGFTFKNCYNNFRNGQRCPLCEKRSSSGGMSKAVRNIIEFLIKNNINFETEKKYDDFKINKRKARYDFYFEDINLLIEYHGKQHFMFEKSGYFNEKKFNEIIYADNLKKEYALKNNINIEYIVYTDNEIEKIKEILLKYKKI